MSQFDDMTQTDQPTDKLHDHHRQQLSAMLDGELLPDQARFMLRRLEHDTELAACWERWQVCGDILRGRHDALLPADFSRRVADAIGGQAQAAGVVADVGDASARRPRWARWGGGAALAASVAMAALFVGRQAPELEPEPAGEQMQVVASTAAPDAATRAPVVPGPAPVAPAPDTASTLAAAVAVAEVPRRAAERRSSNAQQQRAAARNRRVADVPVRVAASGSARSATPARAMDPGSVAGAAVPAAAPVLAADSGVASTMETAAADLFTVEPVQPRPWPRAILPRFPAQDAFTASYGGPAPERHPFHPFEPRVELDLPAEPAQPGASGPR